MKSSCIEHPANEPLIIIRRWQYDFCDGNTTAAALLSFFEYWHNIKLEMQEKNKRLIKVADNHGEEIEVDVSLYQWHTNDDLTDALLGIAKSKNTINDGLELLVSLGVISIHKNPNPKFNFDKTRYFLFYPEVVHNYLTTRNVKNDTSRVRNDNGRVKNDATITEITTENIITTTAPANGKMTNQQTEALKALTTNYQDFISISISPIMADILKEYALKIQPDWIPKAFYAMERANVRNWAYPQKIFDTCIQAGHWVDKPQRQKRNGVNNGNGQSENPTTIDADKLERYRELERQRLAETTGVTG